MRMIKFGLTVLAILAGSMSFDANFAYAHTVSDWTDFCDLGDTCSLPVGGSKVVRFGDSDGPYSYITRSGGSSVLCSWNTASPPGPFTDPEPGMSKHCDYANALGNPLGSADTLGAVIAKVVGQLYLFAIPISSVFIIWGAFQILTSGGEMEKIKKGKKTITYAIIGLILMMFASGIGYVITNILTS